MKILFATAPGYGLTMPVVPLMWAAHAAGHDIRLATTGSMAPVAAAAGIQAVDVAPDRDIWQELTSRAGRGSGGPPPSPFRLFTETMTSGTIGAAVEFGAELMVYTSDHDAGQLAAAALELPGLEVGNRISWSTRDADFLARGTTIGGGEALREQLGVPADGPEVVARIDPRAPSMGGLTADEPDARDGVPWWPMRYVPFNGGAVLEPWVRARPTRPRILITLGTVVPTVSGSSVVTIVLEALADVDAEVVLALGDADISGLGKLPDNVRAVGFLPLSAVLPTTRLIIHHGGSGTTAAPLHFGVPQLVLPSFADNPMSAQRVVDRGVGLSHDPTTLDPPTARGLIDQLLGDPAYARAAAEVRAEMATQPSPSTIIGRVEDWFASRSADGS